jgi:uncharacterized membrane protein
MLKHFSAEVEKTRFEIFFDAILAIIITILVLEFRVPESSFASDTEMKAFIRHLLPSVFSYVISLATIASLWFNHHDLCRMIKKANSKFILLNFVFILFVSPLPFTTALAGRNHQSSFAVMLVASNYFLMSLSYSFLWAYAISKKMIPEHDLKTKPQKRNAMIAMIGTLALMISIPAAFINTYISFSIFIITIILHIGKELYY